MSMRAYLCVCMCVRMSMRAYLCMYTCSCALAHVHVHVHVHSRSSRALFNCSGMEALPHTFEKEQIGIGTGERESETVQKLRRCCIFPHSRLVCARARSRASFLADVIRPLRPRSDTPS